MYYAGLSPESDISFSHACVNVEQLGGITILLLRFLSAYVMR